MSFPINAQRGRLYIICGQTNERYCLPSGVEAGYEGMMHYHLKRHGFERVVFFGHQGCYFLDEFSHDATMTLNQDACALQRPLAHGTGVTLRRNRAAAAPAHVSWRYPDLAQLSQMMSLLRRIMESAHPRSAVVFTDLHILSLHQANTQLRQDFEAYITGHLGRLPIDNQNVMVLNIPGLPNETLQQLGWTRLLSHASGRPLAHSLWVGPPEQDEIANWLFSRYLKKELRIHWLDWREALVRLTSHIKRESLGLHALYRIASEGVLSLDSVRGMCNNADGMDPNALLRELVGLEEVKQYLAEKRASFPPARGASALAAPDLMRICPPSPWAGARHVNLHLLLKGNPGTGKTTVCRILGAFYRDAGMLPLGHVVKAARQDLVGEYMGQTALKTRAVIERALGGVLFIDDAYSLANGENDAYGREAIDAIVEAMTDLPGRLAVVMAGYPEDMDRLLRINTGLKDRFGKVLVISDYRPAEMKQILLSFFSRHPQSRPLHPDLSAALDCLCASLYGNRDREYANARTLEKIALTMIEKAAAEGAEEIGLAHVPEACREWLSKPALAETGLVEDLDALIGLDGVKQSVRALMSRIRVARRRAARGGGSSAVMPGHFVFAGNPGTGKTTVARILAQQFFAMELVGSPHPHTVSAADLIGRYVGDTGQNTREFLEQGLNKVIFIDEAHQLRGTGGMGSDYRRDVIEALVPFVENHRHECVAILAGYEAPIREMLGGDDGLTSRFPNIIRFADYRPEEMLEIFHVFAGKAKMAWDAAWSDLLIDHFERVRLLEGRGFANARSVRNYFESCMTRHAVRVEADEDDAGLFRFALEDLGLEREAAYGN